MWSGKMIPEIEQIFHNYGEALLGKMYSDYVTP